MVDERYECIKQIGHGAYGVVCSGLDTIKNKKIAIKKVRIHECIVRSKMLSKTLSMQNVFFVR